MTMLKVVYLALIVVVLSAHQSEQSDDIDDKYPDLENPVRNSVEDEIKKLPGLNEPINFRQFSGYLGGDYGWTLNGKKSKFMHYWFVESQSDPAKDPLILWLNGGPGCSSLGGLFTELGPFSVNDDGETLKLNKFSWNKKANVLFLESPYGVGFSYSTNFVQYHTDDTTAKENHQALKSFFDKFPEYKNNSLYLTGESYAGVYLPTLGVLVDQDPDMNLKGIAIGNGYLDAAKLSDSLVFFAYHHGLVGKSTWDKISKSCCDGQPPSREACTLSGKNVKWSCSFAVAEVTAALNQGLNPYNIYGKCLGEGSKQKRHSNRELIDRHLQNLTHLASTQKAHQQFHVFDGKQAKLGEEPPCFDDHTLINYLNKPEVRKSIHIPKGVSSWDTCSLIVYVVKYPTQPGGLAPQMKQLIESKRKLTLLVYNGDVDSVCNFLGDEWFVDNLGLKVVAEYEPWKVNKQVAGFVKHYEGMTFATIRGSGHMVPGDRPREAFAMLSVFLNATGHNSFL